MRLQSILLVFTAALLVGQPALGQSDAQKRELAEAKRQAEAKRELEQNALIDYMRQSLSKEGIEEALQYAKSTQPELVERLVRMERASKAEYYAQLSRLLREKKKFESLKDVDPERFQRFTAIRDLELKARRLADAYKAAQPDEKSNISGELNALLSQLFDLRELNRQDEVAQLEARLADLRAMLARRKKSKSLILEKRFAELTGQAHDLEWD